MRSSSAHDIFASVHPGLTYLSASLANRVHGPHARTPLWPQGHKQHVAETKALTAVVEALVDVKEEVSRCGLHACLLRS